MKKIINMILICTTILLTLSAQAKQLRRRPIPVTKNEKQMVIDTKALKQADTPEEKEKAAEKLSVDIKKDRYAQLIFVKEALLQDIEDLEDQIYEEGGYFFDSDEIATARTDLAELKEKLTKVQNELNTIQGKRPREVSRIKEWAVYSLIAAVGIGVALQLAGYDVTGTLMSGAGTVGSKISSGLGTAWSYVPSFRSTPTVTQPSTAGTPSGEVIPPTPSSTSIGSSLVAGATAAGGFAAAIAIEQAKAMAFRTALDKVMAYIFEAQTWPETANPTQLKNAKEEAIKLQTQLTETEKNIAQLKQAQKNTP